MALTVFIVGLVTASLGGSCPAVASDVSTDMLLKRRWSRHAAPTLWTPLPEVWAQVVARHAADRRRRWMPRSLSCRSRKATRSGKETGWSASISPEQAEVRRAEVELRRPQAIVRHQQVEHAQGVSAAELARHQADAAVAEADLAIARAEIAKCTVNAPFRAWSQRLSSRIRLRAHRRSGPSTC